MAIKAENKSEKLTLSEKEACLAIDRFLENTLEFTENNVNNPRETRFSLQNQAYSITDEFKKLFKNTNETLLRFGLDKDVHPDKPKEIILTNKLDYTHTFQIFATKYISSKDRTILSIERSGVEKVPDISSKEKWVETSHRRYQISMNEEEFESFALNESVKDKQEIRTEITRRIDILTEWDINPTIGRIRELKINMEFNPLKKEEFFHGFPMVKKKGLEIRLN